MLSEWRVDFPAKIRERVRITPLWGKAASEILNFQMHAINKVGATGVPFRSCENFVRTCNFSSGHL